MCCIDQSTLWEDSGLKKTHDPSWWTRFVGWVARGDVQRGVDGDEGRESDQQKRDERWNLRSGRVTVMRMDSDYGMVRDFSSAGNRRGTILIRYWACDRWRSIEVGMLLHTADIDATVWMKLLIHFLWAYRWKAALLMRTIVNRMSVEDQRCEYYGRYASMNPSRPGIDDRVNRGMEERRSRHNWLHQ